MNCIRLALVVIVLLPGAPATPRDDPDEDPLKSGGYTVKFPEPPTTSRPEADGPSGKVPVVTAASATPKGDVYLVSYCDLPANAAKPENLKALFEGVREGAAGKGAAVKDTASESEFGLRKKCPYHEFTFKKGDQFVKLWAIVRGERLYQVAAVGSKEFVEGSKDFFNSFTFTK